LRGQNPVAAILHCRVTVQAPCLDGNRARPYKFVNEVRAVLLAVNLPAQQFACYSFRRGAVTTVVMAGIQDSTIQTQGRWKSIVYLLHIKLNPSQLSRDSLTPSKYII